MFGVAQVSVVGQTTPSDSSTPLKVLRKPKPAYTDAARRSRIRGVVSLRVEFLATGEIGEIADVTRRNKEEMAKFGLTQRAVDAARKIQFTPASKDGQPITVSKTLEYTFSVY